MTRRSSLQTTVHPSPGPVVSTTTEGDYSCTNTDAGVLLPIRYAWWVVVQTRETAWIVGPRHFSVDLETAILEVRRHIKEEARLPATAHFVARSVQQTVLARAARAVSKRYGKPMNVAVACWNEDDWRFFEATRDLYGFWVPYMPHWVQLSPAVCGDLERLVYHRGPDRFNHAQMIGLNTLTHEMVHALGVNKGPDMEAKAQCYAMQLSPYMGTALGVPWEFGYRLAHWQVALLWEMPSYYRKPSLCHEGGAWDLDRKHPSPPWHDVRT